MPPFAHQHAGGWAFRVADLEIGGWQTRVIIDQHVNDQPGLLEIEVIEFNPGSLAHRAARAICADEIAAADRPLALRRRDLRADAVAVVLECGELPVVMKLRAGLFCQSLVQFGLNAGLVDHVGGGPAARTNLLCPFKAEQHITLGVEEIIAAGAAGGLHHGISHAGFLQDPHPFVIDMRGAGEWIDRRFLFRDDHRHAATREQDRQGHAGWPAAGDQDITIEPRPRHGLTPPRPSFLRYGPDRLPRSGRHRRVAGTGAGPSPRRPHPACR